MPQLTKVAAVLWDLRAQVEQQIRAITDAQRVVDRYRDTPQSQSQMKSRLQSDLRLIQEAHATIGGVLADCGQVIDALPVTQSTT
jgi:hypothetical protein